MKFVENVKLMRQSLQFVFTKPTYVLLAIFLSIFLFHFFLFIINIPLFLTAIRFESDLPLLFQIFSNIINTIIFVSGPLALGAFAFVTILAGINLSLLVFKYRVAKISSDKSPIFSFGGTFGGALAAGCPSCSISLLTLFGVGGGLAILPFKGIEFSLIGAIILLFSIYSICKSIRYCEACRVYFKK